MKKIIDGMAKLEAELKKNNKISQVSVSYFDSPANLEQLDELEKSGKIEKTVLDFYRASDGFEINWAAVDENLVKNEILGRVKINPFQQVVKKWSGVVYFDGEPENSARRKFFPTDFFVDEAAAGFCSLEGYRDFMYLYKFEGDIIPLFVKFADYLQLMLLAKGCLYWQYLILSIVDKAENEVSSRIKTYLPQLFPGFSFAAFEKYFNENSIK